MRQGRKGRFEVWALIGFRQLRTFSLSVWLVCAAEFLRGVSFSAIFAIYAFQSSKVRQHRRHVPVALNHSPQHPVLYKNIAISTLVLRVLKSLFFDMPC